MDTDKKNKEQIIGPRDVHLFVQGEGLGQIQLISIGADATVRDLLTELAAKFCGEYATGGDFAVTLEDDDREIALASTLKAAGLTNRKRVHVHRCKKVQVSVNFNGSTITDDLPPSTTVKKVKRWADKAFDIDKIDAVEHALQICGTSDRPDEDVHIGTLTTHATCSVCFDLVPKKRGEGAAR